MDVAIVGGGPAGSAAALTLARFSGLETVLVERGDYSETRIGETIGPGVIPLLRFLGVADTFAASQHRQGFSTAAAWGSDQYSGPRKLDHSISYRVAQERGDR